MICIIFYLFLMNLSFSHYFLSTYDLQKYKTAHQKIKVSIFKMKLINICECTKIKVLAILKYI